MRKGQHAARAAASAKTGESATSGPKSQQTPVRRPEQALAEGWGLHSAVRPELVDKEPSRSNVTGTLPGVQTRPAPRAQRQGAAPINTVLAGLCITALSPQVWTWPLDPGGHTPGPGSQGKQLCLQVLSFPIQGDKCSHQSRGAEDVALPLPGYTTLLSPRPPQTRLHTCPRPHPKVTEATQLTQVTATFQGPASPVLQPILGAGGGPTPVNLSRVLQPPGARGWPGSQKPGRPHGRDCRVPAGGPELHWAATDRTGGVAPGAPSTLPPGGWGMSPGLLSLGVKPRGTGVYPAGNSHIQAGATPRSDLSCNQGWEGGPGSCPHTPQPRPQYPEGAWPSERPDRTLASLAFFLKFTFSNENTRPPLHQ